MIIQGDKNYIFGDNNFTNSKNIFRNYIFGDKNEINGDNNFIEGSGNIINKDFNKIFGSLNYINGSLNNINGIFNTIIGNNNFSIQSSAYDETAENYFYYEILFIYKIKELYGTQDKEQFGSSVAVDDNYIYVGSSYFNSNELTYNGKVTIYNKSYYNVVKILYGTQSYEFFGSSVTSDDNYIYVGSPRSNSLKTTYSGKLTIFNKSDYTIIKELYGTQNYEYFGFSVVVDDNYIYVGSPASSSNELAYNGKLTIFNKSDYTIIKELYGTQNYDYLGYSVTIDKIYIFIGSPFWKNSDGNQVGKLTIFSKSDYTIIKELYGGQNFEYFGSSVVVDDNYIYLGSSRWADDNENQIGKLTIFSKSDYSIIKTLSGTQDGEQFGSSVVVDDNYIYVGSITWTDDNGEHTGKLTIYAK